MTRVPGRHELGKAAIAAYAWILALSIGLALGALIGTLIGHVGAGIALGLSVGVVVGLIQLRRLGNTRD